MEVVRVGIVDAVAGGVEADLVVLARDPGEPLRGLDDVDVGVDPDLLELAGEDDRRVLVERDAAGRDLERQALVGTVAQLPHDRASLLAVLLHVGAVAWHGLIDLLAQAPYALRGRLHGAAELGIALVDDVDEGLAVEGELQRLAQVWVVEAGGVPIEYDDGGTM